MNILKKTLIVLTLAAVCSCRPPSLWYINPPGPPEYQLGWEDGCDTGLSAEEIAVMYSLIYGFKKRPEMAASDQYKQGWNEGFTYCRFVLDSKQGAATDYFWGN